jgi:hypothetical protein
MPTVLRCRCGAVLQHYDELPYCNSNMQSHPRPLYYVDLYERLHGKCPSCGQKLPKPSEFVDAIQIEVKPAKIEVAA